MRHVDVLMYAMFYVALNPYLIAGYADSGPLPLSLQ